MGPPKTIRAAYLAALLLVGCGVVPRQELERSRDYGRDLKNQLDRANAEIARIEQAGQEVRADMSRLEQQLAGATEIHQLLEDRVTNLREENDRLHGELTGLVMRASGAKPPASALANVSSVSYGGFELPHDLVAKLDDFAKRHKEVTFDPVERVCRLRADWVFRDGGDRLRGDAQKALSELAEILNGPGVGRLNLLVVGHTAEGASIDRDLLTQHPTDWHLAAHQAIAVEQYLEECGLSPTRAGIVSYADLQPLVSGKDDVAKRKNARVEIFLLPPDPPENSAAIPASN